jgi:hypothetical protein
MEKIKCNKCNKCNKKIGLIVFDCKCKKNFCAIHRYSETHDCIFDFKQYEINKLIKENPKIITPKVSVI